MVVSIIGPGASGSQQYQLDRGAEQASRAMDGQAAAQRKRN